MQFRWNTKIDTIDTPTITHEHVDIVDNSQEQDVSMSCPTYYGVYNPLCPSPSSENREKMMNMQFDRFIYLDNNATHPILPEVREEMNKMMSMIGNGSSPHDAGMRVRAYIEDARIKIAKAIGLIKEEDAAKIIFTSSGTESINTFIKGVFFKNLKSERKIIITTLNEHKATLNSIKWLVDNFNVELHHISIKSNGEFEFDKEFIINNKHKILLVTVMAANNELGIISDYQSLCDFIKSVDSEIKFHVDMSQTLGKMKNVSVLPPDAFTRMDENNFIDAATFTAHKFGGPIGVSAFYVKDFNIFDPLLHGGNQEFQKRASTYNPIQIVGMAKAVELIKDIDIDNMKSLRDYMEEQLISNFNCRINFRDTNRLANTTSVTFFGEKTGEQIVEYLSSKGIFISTTSACNSREKNPSHVLKSMGFNDDDAYRTVRISLNKFTTKENIDDFLSELKGYVL
jgi:cysteine desulfurase